MDKILLGHDYMPNWISVPAMVMEIKNGRVYVEFYSGHKRNFKEETFLDSFTHDKHCISCEAESLTQD